VRAHVREHVRARADRAGCASGATTVADLLNRASVCLGRCGVAPVGRDQPHQYESFKMSVSAAGARRTDPRSSDPISPGPSATLGTCERV